MWFHWAASKRSNRFLALGFLFIILWFLVGASSPHYRGIHYRITPFKFFLKIYEYILGSSYCSRFSNDFSKRPLVLLILLYIPFSMLPTHLPSHYILPVSFFPFLLQISVFSLFSFGGLLPWPLTGFLACKGNLNETHISENSKLVSTNEKKYTFPLVSGLRHLEWL